VPFLSSALLVGVGLYVRLKIHETPDFQAVIDKGERVKVPVVTVFKDHGRALVLGTLMATSTFVLFYLLTVFALSWGTTGLGYSRTEFLVLQLGAVIFFGLLIPPSALLADRFGRRAAMVGVTLAIALFGLFFGQLFVAGDLVAVGVFLVVGLSLMGLTYGPLGTLLAELFPPEVRYTGSSLTFNLAGILGASLAPYAATWLATRHGIAYVGFYLTGAAVLSLVALALVRSEGRRTGVSRV
jgi:MFS family permease